MSSMNYNENFAWCESQERKQMISENLTQTNRTIQYKVGLSWDHDLHDMKHKSARNKTTAKMAIRLKWLNHKGKCACTKI